MKVACLEVADYHLECFFGVLGRGIQVKGVDEPVLRYDRLAKIRVFGDVCGAFGIAARELRHHVGADDLAPDTEAERHSVIVGPTQTRFELDSAAHDRVDAYRQVEGTSGDACNSVEMAESEETSQREPRLIVTKRLTDCTSSLELAFSP